MRRQIVEFFKRRAVTSVAFALVAVLLLSGCGGQFAVGVGNGYGYNSYRRPLGYFDPGFYPYNGYWYDDYVCYDGYWHYRGYDTPYYYDYWDYDPYWDPYWY